MPKGDTLTLKQKTFAEAYATPGTPTFGNGVQSALVAYNAKNDNVAGSMAVETLLKPTVQSYVEQVLEQYDIGHEVRARIIQEIASGIQPPTVQVIKHPDGTETTTTTYHPITATARLKAIDLCYRVDGTYSRAGVEGEIVREEYRKLRARVMKDISPKGNAKAGEAGKGR